MSKNLQQMQQKLLQKELFKKQQQQQVIVGNKIAGKITNALKKLHSQTDENEIDIPKEI